MAYWHPLNTLTGLNDKPIKVIAEGWGAICVNVRNLMLIGPTVAEIWRFFDFSRRRPSAVLDCSSDQPA